jgi:hypothetical protein
MGSARRPLRVAVARGRIGGILGAGMARPAGRRPSTPIPIGVTITAAPVPTRRRTR